MNVTAIRIATDTESLFQGGDFDPALCDQEATRRAYLDELRAELATDYPQARIDITEATVYRTEVSVDTDLDNSRDDDERGLAFEASEAVAKVVDDAAAAVWERGTFWC